MSKEFDNIISFENLYNAHRRARLGKRHKKEVIEFEMNLSQNLWALHHDLQYCRYRTGGYHKFMIYDPKEREIQAISYRDRIVQHTLCDNYLTPLLDKRLIYDNCACRIGKGTSFAISRLRYFILEHFKKYRCGGYFVKCDIRKYFDNIDHTILKDMLARIIEDVRIMNFVDTIIDSYTHHENCGLPMGNQTSQCFALYYLDPIDRMMKEQLKIKHYVRYMDDIVLIVPSKEEAKQCFDKIAISAKMLKLELNRKSQIIAFRNGIEFLGWRFSLLATGRLIQKLKKQAKDRIIHKCKAQIHSDKTEKERSLISYHGYLSKSNSYLFAKKIGRILGKHFINTSSCR